MFTLHYNRYGPKIGGSAPPLGEGELGPYLTQPVGGFV